MKSLQRLFAIQTVPCGRAGGTWAVFCHAAATSRRFRRAWPCASSPTAARTLLC